MVRKDVKIPIYSDLQRMNQVIPSCKLCPRLVDYRENVPARASFKQENYWRKPVPGYGDPNAWLFLLGLAPSAQGGNRTARIFTGDPSGDFLMDALYDEQLASQRKSISRDDGLILKGCYMSAAVKCVPPNNLPKQQEVKNCRRYLINEFKLLKKLKVILALGNFAYLSYMEYVKSQGVKVDKKPFSHGMRIEFSALPTLYVSYHPSPQNTKTGRLTKSMFIKILRLIKKTNSF